MAMDVDTGENSVVNCSNCNKILETDSEIRKELNISSPGDNLYSNLQIDSVLSEIYEIEWKELFMHLCYEEEKKYRGDAFKVLLCDKCAEFLTILYKVYLDFEKLSSSDSLLKKAKEFRLKTSEKSYRNLQSADSEINHSTNEEKLFDSFNFDSDGESEFGKNESEECKYNPVEFTVIQQSSIDSLQSPRMIPTSTSRFTKSPPGKRMIVKLEKIPEEQLPKVKKRKQVRKDKNKRMSSVFLPSTSRKKRGRKSKESLEDLTCPDCNKKFRGAKNLWKHRQIHRKDRFVQCDICGKVLSSKKYMERHRRNHRENRAVNCEICGKLLASKEAIKMHNLRVHISETEKEMQRRPCKICGKMVLRDNKSHMLTHTQEKEKFNCDRCTKSFYSKQRLALHLEAHESTEIFKCTICNREFPTQNYLDEHHERHHNSAKPFACDKCPIKFADKCHLERHVLTHSDDRPFVCDECGNTFRSQRHLKQHIKCHRDEELGAEAFKCQHCGKCLRNSWSLYRHTTKFHRSDLVLAKRVHQCTICQRRLFDEKNLKKHYAAVHKSFSP